MPSLVLYLHDPHYASAVRMHLHRLGLWPQAMVDAQGSIVCFSVRSHSISIKVEEICTIEGVQCVVEPENRLPKTTLSGAVNDRSVAGISLAEGGKPVLMAGPCSVESAEQIEASARIVAQGGGRFLRGGCFKPRSSPYAFQGHGLKALPWMRAAADRHGLKVVTEITQMNQITAALPLIDLVQVGARNMYNYPLLRALGETGCSVLLKRHFGATIDEWLQAGEYLLEAGCETVIYCERGLRGFDSHTRFVLDLGAVALLRHVYHLPVLVDPSHAAGRRDLIEPLSRAALAAGAQGLLIEMHPDPAHAQSDAPQQLPPDAFLQMARGMGFSDLNDSP